MTFLYLMLHISSYSMLIFSIFYGRLFAYFELVMLYLFRLLLVNVAYFLLYIVISVAWWGISLFFLSLFFQFDAFLLTIELCSNLYYPCMDYSSSTIFVNNNKIKLISICPTALTEKYSCLKTFDESISDCNIFCPLSITLNNTRNDWYIHCPKNLK